MRKKQGLAGAAALAITATVLGGTGLTPAFSINCASDWECFVLATTTPTETSYTLTSDLEGLGPVTLSDGKDFTIDLNGYDLTITGATAPTPTGALVVSEGTQLTINDSSGNDSGVLTATAAPHSEAPGIGGLPSATAGAIVINGGTVKATGSLLFENDGGAGIGAGHRGEVSQITINGGNVTAQGGNPSAGIGGSVYGSAGEIEINGGTVYASSIGGTGIGSGSLTESNAAHSGGTVRIAGGNVTAVGGNYSPGIGSGTNSETFGLIHIQGGVVNATGGQLAPGIGGGYSGYTGEIIIDEGADVTAWGGEDAPALGAGLSASFSNPVSIAGTFTLPAGERLDVPGTKTISVTGTLVNNGNIIVAGTLALTGTGTVTNNSVILVGGEGVIDPRSVTQNNYLITFDPLNDSPQTMLRAYAPTLAASQQQQPYVADLADRTFIGWQANGTEWTTSTPLTGDVLVTAQWRQNISPFVGTTKVSINGAPRVGETVTANVTEQPAPIPTSYNYQWFADGREITGAVHDSYVIAPEQVNHALSVQATPVHEGYDSATAVGKSAESHIGPGQLVGNLTARIDGEVQVHNTVSAVAEHSLTPSADLSYQWFMDGVPIEGANAETFTVPQNAAQSQLSVEVSAATRGYATRFATSETEFVLPPRQATISQNHVVAGASVTLSGEGFSSEQDITVTLHSDPVVLGMLRANTTGAVQGTFQIPANTAPGEHHVVLTSANGARLVEFPITVSASSLPTPSSPEQPSHSATQLTTTGAPAAGTFILATVAVLLLLGSATVLYRRRVSEKTFDGSNR